MTHLVRPEQTNFYGAHDMITEEHILEAQKKWGEGIINIGRVFLEKGDHKAAAEHHINTFTTTKKEKCCLSQPLLIKQFRLDFDAAASFCRGQR